MVTHLAVTPEFSGWGLSHSTSFYLYLLFMRRPVHRCAAKMPLPITQPSASARSGRQVTYFEVSKASVAAAGTTRVNVLT